MWKKKKKNKHPNSIFWEIKLFAFSSLILVKRTKSSELHDTKDISYLSLNPTLGRWCGGVGLKGNNTFYSRMFIWSISKNKVGQQLHMRVRVWVGYGLGRVACCGSGLGKIKKINHLKLGKFGKYYWKFRKIFLNINRRGSVKQWVQRAILGERSKPSCASEAS